MNAQNIIEVIDKLVGRISPVGETNTDNERFENLETLCEVLNHYHAELVWLRRYEESYEYSVKRAGERARKFIKFIHEEYGDNI